MTGEFETDVTVHRRNLVRKGKRKQCIGLTLAECWQTLYVRALVETIFTHVVLVNIRIPVIPLDRGVCDVGGPELRVLDTSGADLASGLVACCRGFLLGTLFWLEERCICLVISRQMTDVCAPRCSAVLENRFGTCFSVQA